MKMLLLSLVFSWYTLPHCVHLLDAQAQGGVCLRGWLSITTMLQIKAIVCNSQVNKKQHLDLSLNWTFSDAGAYCVCQGLKHNTSLVYLNLSCTRMTDKGAEYIAQAIEYNCSLQTLDISRNRITDNGFAFIDKSLETNTTLSLHK